MTRVLVRLALVCLVATAGLVAAVPAHASTTSHVWEMDESSGPMLDSGSPTQTNGTWSNIQAGVPGFDGTAYHFNGSSSKVVVSDNASLDPGSSTFTATVHVRFTGIPTASIGGDYDLIRKGLASTSGGFWKVEIDPDSSGRQALGFCQMKGSHSGTKIENAPYSLNDGDWHTISCTKTDTKVTLTVDAQSYSKTVTIGSIANSAPLSLGAKSIGGDWYQGDMDEVSYAITDGNAAPTAQAVTTSTSENTQKTITLTGTDDATCELTFTLASTSAHGGAVGGLHNDPCTQGSPDRDTATVTYTPPADFTGQDTFTYTTTDGGGLTSAPGTVTVTVSTSSGGISLRSSSSAKNATATSLAIPAPSGVASGDVMVAEVAARGTPTITPPSGWTLIRTDVSGTPVTQWAYSKVATGSEPATYTWTFSTSVAAAGGIMDFTGANTSDPIDASGGQVNGKSTSLTAPSITTSSDGDALVAFFDVTQDNTVTPPVAMTESFDLASNAVQPYLTAEGAEEVQADAGATGTRVATAAIEGKSIGQLIAVRSA